MVQDCPDDKSLPWRPPTERPEDEAEKELAAKAASPAAEAEDVAEGAPADGDDAGDFEQPCTQSAMQIAFRDVGSAAPVKIVAVRMLRPDNDAVVATLTPREAAVWNTAGRYETWNEQLAASEKPVNTSYKLSVPSWSDVESKLGKASVGHMFVLEVDVSVGGQTQTVRSTEFTREEPEVIVT
jgi:hypothetical protein